jgi:hypothetical protein
MVRFFQIIFLIGLPITAAGNSLQKLLTNFSNLSSVEVDYCSPYIIQGDIVDPNTDRFKAVKQLIVDKEQSCTATIISPGVALTAAHCLDLLKPKDMSIELSKGVQVKINKFLPHPKYSDQILGSPYDIALITFSPLRSAKESLELDYEIPKINDAVELVGFGNGIILSDYGIDQDGAGVKRHGTNVIGAMTEDGQIVIQSQKGKAAAISGDSGGPLIKNGKMIGVVSSTGYSKDRQAKTTYTPLASKENQDFIQDTLMTLSLKR